MNALMIQQEAQVPSKSDIANAVSHVVEMINQGEMDPLKALGQLSAIEKWAADAKKEIMDSALTEASRYCDKEQKGGIEKYGSTFQVAETGVKYDYSADAEWKELQETINLARAQQKGRETLLKAAGLVPAPTSTTIVKVLLNK